MFSEQKETEDYVKGTTQSPSPPHSAATSHSSRIFGRLDVKKEIPCSTIRMVAENSQESLSHLDIYYSTTATKPSAPIRRRVEIIEIDSDEEDPETDGAPGTVIEKEKLVEQVAQGPTWASSTAATTQSKEPAMEDQVELVLNKDQRDTVERLKDEGNSHFKAGRLNEANDCYTRGLKIDDRNPVLYSNRSLVLYKVT